jgi:hypothetical protein
VAHTYASSVKTPATCTANGTTTYTCSCGRSYDAQDIPATNHDYELTGWAWAEDYSKATATFTCKNDGTHVETAVDSAPAKTIVTGQTCTTDHVVKYTAKVTFEGTEYTDTTEEVKLADRLGHDYELTGWAWAEDYSSATATFTCKNDGTHVETVVDNEPVMNTISGQTCTTDHVVKYTATVTFEGDTYTNTTDEVKLVDRLGHDFKVVVTDPTCTEGGYTTYICSRCGNTYTADETEALGHNPGEAAVENKVDATCTDAGSYDSVVYCAVCGDELSRESGIVIPAKGHTPGEVMTENIVPATCTAEGSYDEAVYCDVCGDEISRETITVPADPDAHVWGAWTATVTPTCTVDGVEIRYCECDASHFENRIVYASGHTWGEWVTVSEATVNENGLERRACLVCGETEEREIRFVGEKNRTVQFVVSGSMHYVVHMPDVNYEIYSKQTPAIYWYDGADLTFDIVLHPDCGYENYIVTLNDKELKQNADGSYTIPGGTEYVKINVNPVTTAADNGGSGSHTASACRYCGKVHPGNFWGMLVAFFHAIFYFFKHLFG